MESNNRKFNIEDTTATHKVFDLTKRIRAVAGGTSASKTISILIWLISYCQHKQERDKLVTVVSESYPHLEKGVISDFKMIMRDHGYWRDELWNETKHIYKFETGNVMEFFSVDTYGKAHGPRRDVLFINEANNLHYNIVDQLITRTREIIWLDWNPTDEFWFYTDMQPNRTDIDFITLTYKDNEALDATTITEIESHRNNKAWWQVYGLGQLGTLEGRIYKDWVELDDLPPEALLVRRGLDFGYTNDPTVIMDIYKYNDGFVIDELVYQKGLSNRTIADILTNNPKILTIADSAEPKSIDEINNYGVQIIGAVKGAGSVYQGIQFVQAQKIYITKRSIKTLKAYRNYMFLMDKNGKITNQPDDSVHEWSNPMDAIRYGLDSYRPRKKPVQPTTFGGVARFIDGIG